MWIKFTDLVDLMVVLFVQKFCFKEAQKDLMTDRREILAQTLILETMMIWSIKIQ